MLLSRPQREALLRVYRRMENPPSYLAFRRTVVPYIGDTSVLVPFAGMWLGIEPDGYTHS